MTAYAQAPALTREERKAVCVHEAGHAVLHALGGAFVYRVAVAPEGATEWTTTARKGEALADLVGAGQARAGAAGLQRLDLVGADQARAGAAGLQRLDLVGAGQARAGAAGLQRLDLVGGGQVRMP
jgi:hypothetical protein